VVPRQVQHVEKSRSDPSDDPIVGAKVLVVDDDVRNVFAMQAFLERVHAEVSIAESGADAIALLEQRHDIDIVLMDIMMPGMDGYAAIRAIRALDHCSTLPIIAVTGKAVAGEHKRCIEAGANDCVLKPVDTVELLAVMRPWLPTSTRPTRSTPNGSGPSLSVVSNG
jgi:CheY-like chemotaxis protein